MTKSKEAADVANIRAAFAEAQVKIITEDIDTDNAASVFAAYTAPTISITANYTAPSTASSEIRYKAKELDGGKTYTWTLGSGATTKL